MIHICDSINEKSGKKTSPFTFEAESFLKWKKGIQKCREELPPTVF